MTQYLRQFQYVSQLQTGQRFMLMRTREKYTFVRREFKTPGGTRYVVKKDGESKEATLNHQCVVKPIATPCRKCGGKMIQSKAIQETYTGIPDFPDGEVCTVSHGGTGRLIDCMKCEQCGWSVT